MVAVRSGFNTRLWIGLSAGKYNANALISKGQFDQRVVGFRLRRTQYGEFCKKKNAYHILIDILFFKKELFTLCNIFQIDLCVTSQWKEPNLLWNTSLALED